MSHKKTKKRMSKISTKPKKSTFRFPRFSRLQIILFVLGFGAIGGYLILKSFAATGTNLNYQNLNSTLSSSAQALPETLSSSKRNSTVIVLSNNASAKAVLIAGVSLDPGIYKICLNAYVPSLEQSVYSGQASGSISLSSFDGTAAVQSAPYSLSASGSFTSNTCVALQYNPSSSIIALSITNNGNDVIHILSVSLANIAPLPLKIGVPSYWWPPTTYDTQLAATGTLASFAVVNPDSGPSTGPTSNFTSQIASYRAAGIKAYGYVSTQYGARAISTVKSDIDKWYSWYGIDGIFLDEGPGTGWTSAQQSYYQVLNTYIKGKTGTNVHGTSIILNPGTDTDQYAMKVADIVCNYEDTEANYAGASFPSWVSQYPAWRFYHIILGSAGVTQMQHDIQLAKSRNAGNIFVTTYSGSNPYNALPSTTFWNSEKASL